MAQTFTLSDYKNLVPEMLKKGVIDCMAKESQVLSNLAFMPVNNLFYAYNQADYTDELLFVQDGEGYEDREITITKDIVELKHTGAYATVSQAKVLGGGNLNDLRAEATTIKANALARGLERAIFYADATKDANSFDGVVSLVTKGKAILQKQDDMSTLTYFDFCSMVDKIQNANTIVMHPETLRRLELVFKGESVSIVNYKDADLGTPVKFFDKCKIATSYKIDKEDIFVMECGSEGVVIPCLESPVRVQDLGLGFNQPVYKTQISSDMAVAILKPRACGMITSKAITQANTPIGEVVEVTVPPTKKK